MERTNARTLDEHSLPEQLDAASIDVAFISLDKILPAVKKLLAPDAFVLALIKPQFEAGKEHIGKKGVVRDPCTKKSSGASLLWHRKKDSLSAVWTFLR